MTNVQSKMLASVACTCKDFHHPWTDKCINATAGLLLASTPYCLRVYTVVYALSFLMQHRIPRVEDLKRTIMGILQSSAFLITNAYTFIMYNCLIRNLIGRYYCATVAFVPCFLASLTAILVERPARRPLLTLYVANVATETLWNMMEARGFVRSIPQGQTLIFGVSIATLCYLYRLGLHKSSCKDSIFSVVARFIDKTEEGPVLPLDEEKSSATRQRSRAPVSFRSINAFVQIYSRFLAALKGKHETCRHRDTCIKHAVMSGVKPFLGGVGIQVALKFVMNIKNLITMRMKWRKTIFNRSTLNLGVFMGSFSVIYHAISCILRHSFDRDDPRFAIPAGLCASVAFTQYPDVTVALYVMWKALQISYNLGIERGVVPQVPGFMLCLYSVCTAVLFHAGILEPDTLRQSYFRFLQAISGDRLSKFNLEPFDVYNLQTSQKAKEVLQRLNIVNTSPLPKFSLASLQ